MNKEELTHPGAGDKIDISFEAYLPFFNTEGLTEDLVKDLIGRLCDFYQKSHNSDSPTIWQPGSCHRTKDYFFAMQHTFDPLPVSLMHNPTSDHYWYQLATLEGVVVIDPAGLPKNQEITEEMKKFLLEHGGQSPFLNINDLDITTALIKNREKNPAYQFRGFYRPYFGLEENAPDFHKKIYGDPDVFEVSVSAIGRYVNNQHERWD